jgi:hypothetical protein
MGKINMGRVILGGVAATVVLNASDGILNSVILADQWAAYMQSVGKEPAFGATQIAGFMINGLILGIAMVWLYAAIRPRFGAGAATALRAGAAVWVIGYLVPNVAFIVGGLAPEGITMVLTVVGIAQTALAALAGAWVYKES